MRVTFVDWSMPYLWILDVATRSQAGRRSIVMSQILKRARGRDSELNKTSRGALEYMGT